MGEIIIKKKFILIITLIMTVIVTSTFIVINSNGREKSIEEALNIETTSNSEIIYEEPTDKGSIIFGISTENSKEYLFTAFVNKNLFGYKDLYSGVSSIDGSDTRDLTVQYFPAIKQTSLPIYFGVILNNEIETVSVKQVNSSEVKMAKIIEAGDTRIWLVYMNGFEGSEFEIDGYSRNGTCIYSLKDTTPWEVEQKPIKSPYE